MGTRDSGKGWTPGPWAIDHQITDHGAPIITAFWQERKRTRVVAKAWFEGGSDDVHVHANARLIAVAPEMAEALRPFAEMPCERPSGSGKPTTVLAAAIQPDKDFDPSQMKNCGECDTCRAAAALAKARGET